MAQAIDISGTLAPGFERVRDVFEAHFSSGDIYQEVGASFCAYHQGRCVVDLWGGVADRRTGRPWARDTTANLYSTTKAIAALCLAMQVDRGLVDYEDLVGAHWPEFAANGKEATTVAHLASHQSGNPGLREPTELDELLDWPLITGRLERQAPFWKPGEATAYHPWTYGFLVGEIVRRVSGRSIGQVLAEDIAGPIAIEAYIGLPPEKDGGASVLYGPKTAAAASEGALPDFIVAAMTNPPLEPERPNLRPWRAAELPGIGGFASASALAKMFAVCAEGGELDGVRLLSAAGIDRMTTVQSTRVDGLLGAPAHWAHGVVLNNLGIYGPNPRAFGHSGWGGSFVCADRDARAALGYVVNQMGPDPIGDPRALRLVEAFYSCL